MHRRAVCGRLRPQPLDQDTRGDNQQHKAEESERKEKQPDSAEQRSQPGPDAAGTGGRVRSAEQVDGEKAESQAEDAPDAGRHVTQYILMPNSKDKLRIAMQLAKMVSRARHGKPRIERDLADSGRIRCGFRHGFRRRWQFRWR